MLFYNDPVNYIHRVAYPDVVTDYSGSSRSYNQEAHFDERSRFYPHPDLNQYDSSPQDFPKIERYGRHVASHHEEGHLSMTQGIAIQQQLTQIPPQLPLLSQNSIVDGTAKPLLDQSSEETRKKRKGRPVGSRKSKVLSCSSWLEESFSFKSMKKRPIFSKKSTARRLVLSEDAGPRVAHPSGQVVVEIMDLPDIECPFDDCEKVFRGRDALEDHLKAGSDSKDPGHGLFHSNTSQQTVQECVVSTCSIEVAKGGVLRHLIEHHSNVWIYCTLCDHCSTRKRNTISHFETEHGGFVTPAFFREIMHQPVENT
ncbi:hypothetical protein CVT25_001858 [Psilocybe cyanescens]|uniref:C2H2-type domain-containing protein n=1 Tax=Psilocybe cyanescens TaxID=93625 RepID=A0A409WQE9_PSICY|nr:hypothetical protein CVT25_001858 [Psilocybe cyanescens]